MAGTTAGLVPVENDPERQFGTANTALPLIHSP
jgi:hypothetical protein